MSDAISEIRRLLDELERGMHASSPAAADGVTLNESAQIVADVVDYLQPLLTPYQAAFYWYLLRRSYFGNGGDLVRVSTRGLGKGVMKSARSDTVSQSQVKELLAALEAVDAIRKEAEPNRDGTLYRVMIPSQIPACQVLRSQLQDLKASPVPREAEVDYYNVRENRRKIYERDNYVCHYCAKQLDQATATLDHIVAIVAGGKNSSDNLVTSCLSCNSRKNRRPVGDFLADGPQF